MTYLKSFSFGRTVTFPKFDPRRFEAKPAADKAVVGARHSMPSQYPGTTERLCESEVPEVLCVWMLQFSLWSSEAWLSEIRVFLAAPESLQSWVLDTSARASALCLILCFSERFKCLKSARIGVTKLGSSLSMFDAVSPGLVTRCFKQDSNLSVFSGLSYFFSENGRFSDTHLITSHQSILWMHITLQGGISSKLAWRKIG